MGLRGVVSFIRTEAVLGVDLNDEQSSGKLRNKVAEAEMS